MYEEALSGPASNPAALSYEAGLASSTPAVGYDLFVESSPQSSAQSEQDKPIEQHDAAQATTAAASHHKEAVPAAIPQQQQPAANSAPVAPASAPLSEDTAAPYAAVLISPSLVAPYGKTAPASTQSSSAGTKKQASNPYGKLPSARTPVPLADTYYAPSFGQKLLHLDDSPAKPATADKNTLSRSYENATQSPVDLYSVPSTINSSTAAPSSSATTQYLDDEPKKPPKKTEPAPKRSVPAAVAYQVADGNENSSDLEQAQGAAEHEAEEIAPLDWRDWTKEFHDLLEAVQGVDHKGYEFSKLSPEDRRKVQEPNRALARLWRDFEHTAKSYGESHTKHAR